MKKIMILAAAAIAAVACSKTYQAEPVSEQAIGFTSWTEQLTKTEAREQGTSTFKAGDTFAVYATKTNTSGSSQVFNGDVVTASGDPVDTWTYTATRFWDNTYDSYVFYAVSPSGIKANLSVDSATGAITTSTAFTFAGTDNDILVADKTTVTKSAANYSSTNKVAMNFNHVASLIDVKAKKTASLDAATVTVSAISVNNVYNTGNLEVSNAYNSNAYGGTLGPVVTWTAQPTTPTTANYTSGAETITLPQTLVKDTAFTGTSDTTPAASTDLIKNLVVMPQAISGKTITITYKIAVSGAPDIENTATIPLADFDIKDNNKNTDSHVDANWVTGKHYTYYITIDANAIVFTASIHGWVDATNNGYYYLVN